MVFKVFAHSTATTISLLKCTQRNNSVHTSHIWMRLSVSIQIELVLKQQRCSYSNVHLLRALLHMHERTTQYSHSYHTITTEPSLSVIASFTAKLIQNANEYFGFTKKCTQLNRLQSMHTIFNSRKLPHCILPSLCFTFFLTFSYCFFATHFSSLWFNYFKWCWWNGHKKEKRRSKWNSNFHNKENAIGRKWFLWMKHF